MTHSAENDAGREWPACATYPNLGCVCRSALGQSKSTCTRKRTGDLTQIPGLPSVDNDAPPCDATTASGTPCQKRLYASSDGEFWPHAGGHWFMPDDVYACLIDGHYDAASVLTHGPLVHLDVPCTRVTPPADGGSDA